MGEKQAYRFSIRKKLVLGAISLAVITFGTSGFFIFYVATQIIEQVQGAKEQSEKGSDTNSAIGAMEKSIHEVVAVIQEISVLINEQMSGIMNTSKENQEVAAIAE